MNKKLEFQTLSDFKHCHINCIFCNNEIERQRKEKAKELLELAKEFGIKGFIFEFEHFKENYI